MEQWEGYHAYLDVRFFHLFFIVPNYNLACRKYRALKRKASHGECMLLSRLYKLFTVLAIMMNHVVGKSQSYATPMHKQPSVQE